MSIYNIKVKDMNQQEVALQDYSGKVLLIVNTATECGLTPQYEQLQQLYVKYKDQGFEILDFPCDQFGHQAPGTNEEIATFCTGRFGVTFKQFAKIEVNGENEAELYKYLKDKKSSLLGRDIKWNFAKFLINKNGEVVKRYEPTTKPEKLEKDIVKLIEG